MQCMADDGTSVLINPDGLIGTCEHYVSSDFFGNINNNIIDSDILKGWREYENDLDICKTCPKMTQYLHRHLHYINLNLKIQSLYETYLAKKRILSLIYRGFCNIMRVGPGIPTEWEPFWTSFSPGPANRHRLIQITKEAALQ